MVDYERLYGIYNTPVVGYYSIHEFLQRFRCQTGKSEQFEPTPYLIHVSLSSSLGF